MRNNIYILPIALGSLLLFLGRLANAQSLSHLKKDQAIKVNGGFSAQGTFYDASGIENRRDPFFWILSGNLNINILGINIPISASFSQQQRRFTQPFNQYGLSPNYKSITAHLGYRSMNFSQFTMSGLVFLGAGVEVAPQNLPVRFSALYGRFVRAVPAGAIDGLVAGVPAYERWGYGAKVGLGKDLNRTIELMFFKAKDDETSIPNQPFSAGLTPAENIVLGAVLKQMIGKHLFFDIDFASSAYTKDVRLPEVEASLTGFKSVFNPIFSTNTSSQFNNAVHTNLGYRASLYEIKLAYRRIDPEFKSMGAIFLNNDLEDITGNMIFRLADGKFSISGSGGIQRNNLNSDLLSRLTRGIWAINITYNPSKKLNFNASYNNFSSSTRLVQVEEADSLFYAQTTRSANLGINYTSSGKRVKHSIFSNLTYQAARDNQTTPNTFYNASLGYQYALVPLFFNLTTSLNINHNAIESFNSTTVGPAISLNKLFWNKKLRTNFTTSFVNMYNAGTFSSRNLNIRLSENYTINKYHAFSINLIWLKRNTVAANLPSFSEFRGTVGYNYKF